MENTNTKENTKRSGRSSFNPTIAVMFNNDKFGSGSLLSVPINAEGYEAIQKHIQINSRLLLKKSKLPAKNGTDVFFLEVLPPLEETIATRRASNKGPKTSSDNDEI